MLNGDQIPAQKTHKFYDSKNGKTGCDEVLFAVQEALRKAGIQAWVSFTNFDMRP